MSVYCISYTISNTLFTDNSTRISNAIMNYGQWWHQSDNVWYIETNQTERQIFDNLRNYIGNGDKLFVVKIQNAWWGIGYTEAEYNWLRNKIF